MKLVPTFSRFRSSRRGGSKSSKSKNHSSFKNYNNAAYIKKQDLIEKFDDHHVASAPVIVDPTAREDDEQPLIDEDSLHGSVNRHDKIIDSPSNKQQQEKIITVSDSNTLNTTAWNTLNTTACSTFKSTPQRTPSLPKQARAIKQQAFRERLQSLSDRFIQDSPVVVADTGAAAAAGTAGTTTTSTTPKTFEMEDDDVGSSPLSTPSRTSRSAILSNTSISTTTTSQHTTDDLFSEVFSTGDATTTDASSSHFDFSQQSYDRHPQKEQEQKQGDEEQQQRYDMKNDATPTTTTTAAANLDGHRPYQQQQYQQVQRNGMSSPAHSMLTEGTNATGTTSIYSAHTTGADSHKSNWAEALTWWGRNPCLVLEELAEYWDPDEHEEANGYKDKNRNKNRKRVGRAGTGAGVGAEALLKWFPNWNISSQGEELVGMRDCANSILNPSAAATDDVDSHGSSSLRRHPVSSAPPSKAAAARSILLSSVLDRSCQSPDEPSQQGFEREASTQHQSREGVADASNEYNNKDEEDTIPEQFIALESEQIIQVKQEITAAMAEAMVAAARRGGIQHSASDASTITTNFSL